MSLAKGTVLIIEDSLSNAEMAMDLLQDAGFDTWHANDVDEGLDYARHHHPDLVLMDMFLPFKSGMDTIPVFKNDPELQNIPLIAFTALGLEEERNQLLKQGCDGIITKPIDVSHFAEIVEKYLSAPVEHSNVQSKPMSGTEAEAKPFSDAQLQESQNALKETISKLSHDIQGPVRKIHQFCDILRSSAPSNLSQENRDWVDRIDRNAEDLLDTLSKNLAKLKSI